MKRALALTLLLSVIGATLALAAPDAHVLMISVDGLMPSTYTLTGRPAFRSCAAWRLVAHPPGALSPCSRR